MAESPHFQITMHAIYGGSNGTSVQVIGEDKNYPYLKRRVIQGPCYAWRLRMAKQKATKILAVLNSEWVG